MSVVDRSGELIKDLALKSKSAQIVACPQEPKDVYLLQKPDGLVERHVAEAAPRNYVAFRVSDIVSMVEHYAALATGKLLKVFCGRGKVSVLFDEDGARRDRITLSVPDSKQYTLLCELERGREFESQKDLVSMLRVDLAGAVPMDFVALMRQLKFDDSNKAESTLAAGKESLGGTVYREALAGGREMPEEVIFHVPVYEDLVGRDGDQFSIDITAIVDVNMVDRTIRLVPKPPELLAARRCADTWLYTQLRSLETSQENVKVFCGAPN